MKTFSIVLPCYNDLSLLRNALASVLQQKGVDYEVIISDDSQDDCIEHYVQSLSHDDIHYYRHQQGISAADNWNSGLQKASGKYVILMHHDEEMAQDDYLKRISQQMSSVADIVISQVNIIANRHQKKQSFLCRWMKTFVCKHPVCLFLMNVIGPCACLTVRREHLEDFNTNLKWFVDVEWYYRMLREKKFIFDKSLTIISHHGHQGQITQSLNVMETFKSDRSELLQKYTSNRMLRLMLWLYQHLILGTKHLLRKI
ncbi:MAG: glycosyltransferase [Prevotella sp.]|nr:glycosyltransferase [Prevotella sp.]